MSSTQEFLRIHPLCCFCGGSEAATTVDHQPAKIVFPDKSRPKGLEFPACSTCNRQTSGDEALLALVSRFAGSHRPNAARDFHRLKDIINTVRQVFPGLLERMHARKVWANRGGLLMRQGAIDVNQPEVHQSMSRIAAKLALAIYYQAKGTPAATTCRIKTQWTHCQNPDTSQRVKNLIQIVPAQAILQMGKWKTDESFFLKFHSEDHKLASVAIFHEAVALIALLQEAPLDPNDHERWDFVMAPKAKIGIAIVP
jgi:hypothetical protein